MARKSLKTLKTNTAVSLDAEIAINEAAAPSIIDHASQIESWTVEDEAALLKAEAIEDAPVETVAEIAPSVQQSGKFEEILASYEDALVTAMAHKIAAEVDARAVFEDEKNPENTSIQRTLKKVRSELVTKRAARVMLATGVEPNFINRVLHDGSRYNVYALGKYADLVRSLVDGHGLNNAINNAVAKSLFRCKNAGIAFTGEVAKAAASDKIRLDATIAKTLVRHTVSSSTAPTQASSTMSALQTLGVVKIEGSSRNPTYRVTENPISNFLEAKLLTA
jgi:hypothetical protein